VPPLHLGRLGDRLAVGDGGQLGGDLDAELLRQPPRGDLDVRVPHAGEDGLVRLAVAFDAERRILFHQARQADAQFVQVGLGLGKDGGGEQRLRVDDGCHHVRHAPVAQRVSGAGDAQFGHRANAARRNGRDGRLLLAAQGEQLADPLLNVLVHVQHSRVGRHRAGEHSQVGHLAHERVGQGLEHLGDQGTGGICRQRHFLAGGLVGGPGRHVRRAGHIAHHCVQQAADADVPRGGARQHQHETAVAGSGGERPDDLLLGEFLVVQVLHHQGVVGLGGVLHHLQPGRLRRGAQRRRDVALLAVRAEVRLHGDEVDDAVERCERADGQRDGHELGLELGPQLGERPLERGVVAIHLVDKDHARHGRLVRILPLQFRADLDARGCADDHDRAVRRAQAVLDLAHKVGVAGHVQDVQQRVLPVARQHGQVHRDPAVVLVIVIVRGGVLFLDRSQARDGACIEEENLAEGCLAARPMPQQHDIANLVRPDVSHQQGSLLELATDYRLIVP